VFQKYAKDTVSMLQLARVVKISNNFGIMRAVYIHHIQGVRHSTVLIGYRKSKKKLKIRPANYNNKHSYPCFDMTAWTFLHTQSTKTQLTSG
jgi:hypothetical protein